MSSGAWRWVLFDAALNVVDHGQRGPWPPVVGDLNAVADELMAERAAVMLRDGQDLTELSRLICRTWQGGTGFNADGEPVDEHGTVLPYGESRGAWITAGRVA
jgi:hypothetical protein